MQPYVRCCSAFQPGCQAETGNSVVNADEFSTLDIGHGVEHDLTPPTMVGILSLVAKHWKSDLKAAIGLYDYFAANP